ncbi:MAG: zinc ribbon domain-containing protein, partial [Sulfuriferula sp.]
RALCLLAATSIAAVLLASVFGFIASRFGMGAMAAITGGLGMLIAAVVFFTGFSAVGILLMDEAKLNPQRSIANALFAGLATLPRFIGLVLLEVVLVIAFVIALAIVLFICKIPGLGVVLYAVVYPVSVVIVGIVYFAVLFVVNPLAAPALWDGNSVMQALAKLWQLGKTQLIPVVLNQLVLGLIVLVVASILFGMVAIGSVFTTTLSAQILGSEMGGSSMMSMLNGLSGMMMGGGSGYALGLIFGSAILFAIVGAIPLLVLMSGNCLIYLQYARNLDTAAMEEKMRSAVGDLKDKANAAREQLKQAQVTPPTATVATPALTCPSCHAGITVDDVFCGSCGHKLK